MAALRLEAVMLLEALLLLMAALKLEAALVLEALLLRAPSLLLALIPAVALLLHSPSTSTWVHRDLCGMAALTHLYACHRVEDCTWQGGLHILFGGRHYGSTDRFAATCAWMCLRCLSSLCQTLQRTV